MRMARGAYESLILKQTRTRAQFESSPKLPRRGKSFSVVGMRRILFQAGAAFALCVFGVPAARAMLASNDGVVSHNTDPSTARTDISKLWNRTAKLGAGTGTYLGQAADGTRWVLTAAHVSSLSGTITDTSGATHALDQDASVSAIRLINPNGSAADLKLFAVTRRRHISTPSAPSTSSRERFTRTRRFGSSARGSPRNSAAATRAAISGRSSGRNSARTTRRRFPGIPASSKRFPGRARASNARIRIRAAARS